MQKIPKCARQKVLYLNYLHIEPYKQDKTKKPQRDTHTYTQT